MKNGSLWIYQVDGKLVKEYFYEGAKDLSSQCFDLPAGNTLSFLLLPIHR
ncbi:MAG: hypothetical protein ACLTZT_11235 [Butyricimonas faecalis]